MFWKRFFVCFQYVAFINYMNWISEDKPHLKCTVLKYKNFCKEDQKEDQAKYRTAFGFFVFGFCYGCWATIIMRSFKLWISRGLFLWTENRRRLEAKIIFDNDLPMSQQ